MAVEVGLTKDFLESVLKTKVYKFQVAPGDNGGFTCAVLEVDIWRTSSGNPEHLIIKCFPSNPARQALLDSSGMFARELDVYRELIPGLLGFQKEFEFPEELPFAPFVYGNYLSAVERSELVTPMLSVENCIIMKNLGWMGFKLRDRFLALDFDHYKLVIEAQARLHGISWAYKIKHGIKKLEDKYPFLALAKLQGTLGILAKFIHSNFTRSETLMAGTPHVLSGLNYLRSVSLRVSELYYEVQVGSNIKKQSKDSVLKTCGNILENEEPWAVLVHGDAWSNNMMFRYDPSTEKPVQVMFVDLQVTREADPVHDIVYGIYSSTTKQLRNEHLDSLLRIYYNTFSQICEDFHVHQLPGWSWDEFKRRVHRAKIWGGNIAVSGLPVFLHEPDDFISLDDMAETSIEDSTDRTQRAIQYYSKLGSSGKVNPILQARIQGVLEDLIGEGLI